MKINKEIMTRLELFKDEQISKDVFCDAHDNDPERFKNMYSLYSEADGGDIHFERLYQDLTKEELSDIVAKHNVFEQYDYYQKFNDVHRIVKFWHIVGLISLVLSAVGFFIFLMLLA